MFKYIVCPGEVTSRTDGQRHYIGAMRLMKLYGVNPQECEIYEPAPWWPRSYYKQANWQYKGAILLEPRFDGNYTIDKATRWI